MRSPGARVILALALSASAACAAGGGDGADWPAIVGPEASCVGCHSDVGADLRAAGSHRGADGRASCLLCHEPHAGEDGSGPSALRAACEDCHASTLAEFQLPFGHNLGAGMECLSCHPPHGLAGREEREHLRHEVCVACHREYAGPFHFHHEGSRNLQCLSCHLPHGAPNRRLLFHSETRMLCFSCHLFLPDEHQQGIGSRFRECLDCHVAIHGSHWSRELLR